MGGGACSGAGGVASLNHRLQGGIPPGCEGGELFGKKGVLEAGFNELRETRGRLRFRTEH